VSQKHSGKTVPLAGGARSRSNTIRLFVVLTALWLGPRATLAQSTANMSSEPTFSTGFRFAEQSGETLFKGVCQACHMPSAEGATGAGSYPSLASDPALGDYGYPVYIVVFGKRAMPPFGDMMNNDQVAAVVNYVRTHFGNHYPDQVTAEEIQAMRR
jgi:mono/diheme cytochrome c family protein